MASLPVARPYSRRAIPEQEIAQLLLDDLYRHYGQITDVRWTDLGDLWQLARDLVLAIDRWARKLGGVSGEQKMELAEDVAWAFIADRGGLAAIRDRIADAIDSFLPGFIVRWVVGRVVSEQLARGIIRFVLELAVQELLKIQS